MSTKYTLISDVPNDVLANRLFELSDAVVARMNGQKDKFMDEFSCRIPAELDRDADLVLMEAAKRLQKIALEEEMKS